MLAIFSLMLILNTNLQSDEQWDSKFVSILQLFPLQEAIAVIFHQCVSGSDLRGEATFDKSGVTKTVRQRSFWILVEMTRDRMCVSGPTTMGHPMTDIVQIGAIG